MDGLDQTVKNPISNLEIAFLRIVLSKIKCMIFNENEEILVKTI